MASAVEAVGLISGVLGIWTFVADQLPEPEDAHSSYHIQVGVDDTEGTNPANHLSNAGGTIDKVKTYNSNGNLIGSGGGDGAKVENGEYVDISIEQTNHQQTITSEFYAGDDAVCIAAITATMDEGSDWGWVGDWGYICGLDWFPSGYHLQNSEGTDASPRCTWVDNDHTNGIKAAVIGITWNDFSSEDNVPDGDTKKLCGTSFRAWDSDGGKQLLPVSTDLEPKRDVRRSQRSDDSLVISSLPNHNATEVCQSETSRGPDFVAKGEGVYCNMETHETSPLCGNGITEDCFALDGPDGPTVVARNGKRSPKKPSRIIEW